MQPRPDLFFGDHGKRRTTGYVHLDYYTGSAAIIVLCLDEVINDSSSTQVDFPKGVDNQTRDMLKAAGARAKRRSRARKEA